MSSPPISQHSFHHYPHYPHYHHYQLYRLWILLRNWNLLMRAGHLTVDALERVEMRQVGRSVRIEIFILLSLFVPSLADGAIVNLVLI